MSIPLFLDFDGTLFDTEALKKELNELFFAFGADKEMHRAAYQPMRESGLYEPLDHAKLIWGKVPEGFEEAVETLLTTATRFAYPDARHFLKLFANTNYDLKVLTQGSPGYQHKKINASGLAPFLPEILVCQENKWEIMLRHVEKDTPFLLVEDRTDTIVMIAKTHPKGYGIVIDRHGIEPHGTFPLFQITSSFAEIMPLPDRFPALAQ